MQQHTSTINQIYALHSVGKLLGFNFRIQDKVGKAIRWADVLLQYDIEDDANKLSSSRASWVSKGGGDVMGSQQAAERYNNVQSTVGYLGLKLGYLEIR